MAEGDELNETLERAAKPWSALLGALLETKRQVLNSPYGQQFKAITFTKTPGCRQSGKNLSATKNTLMNTTVVVYRDGESNGVHGQLPREFFMSCLPFLGA